MRYFFFKNSNEQIKNMFPYAEKYIQGAGPNPRYAFDHTTDAVFQSFATDTHVNVLHRLCSKDSFSDEPFPSRSFTFDELAQAMDETGCVHFVSVNLQTNVSDQQVIDQSHLAILGRDGEFLDAKTREPLAHDLPTAIMLFSGFKVGTDPIYLIVCHSPFVVPAMEDITTDSITVRRITEMESIKSTIFPVEVKSGADAVIGGNMVFASNNHLVFKTLPDCVSPHDIDFSKIKIECDAPFTIDTTTGNISFDITSMESKSCFPLKIILDGGPFLNWWINTSQRFVYEYLIYKMVR